jgi:hypothetical protein
MSTSSTGAARVACPAEAEAVIADLVRLSQAHDGPIGLLTHHLVHDASRVGS